MPGYTFGLGFMVRQGPGIVGVMGCNSRRMVATAAHLTDHVLPPPTRKCHDKRAEQTVAGASRRLTRPTGSSTLRLTHLK